MTDKQEPNIGQQIFSMAKALLFFYVLISVIAYTKDPDPYGVWHFLTRGKGWVNSDLPMSGILHFLTPNKG